VRFLSDMAKTTMPTFWHGFLFAGFSREYGQNIFSGDAARGVARGML
jgi:hypothetical protein